MKVLVDLDGVAADWGFGYDVEADFYGLFAEGGVPYSTRPGWDLRAGLSKRGIEINRWIMEKPGFYRNLPLVEDAKWGIQDLVKSGHDVFFVSTPYLSNPTCASDKVAWVEQHFGDWGTKRLILTSDKTMVRGDVLIDDKPFVEGSMPPEWKHLCFGEYGYSAETRSERAKTWYDAINAVTLLQWERDLLAVKTV